MHYTQSSAKQRLIRNDIKVDEVSQFITIPYDKDVGNKLWGAIDYLVNHCGYFWIRETDY
jgi:hypothetical protein